MAKKAKGIVAEAADTVKARTLLDKALSTISRELEKIEAVSSKDPTYPMAPEHMIALNTITKTLVAVDKNSHDNPEDDPDETDLLTDDELRARAAVILKEQKK